jgi:hypothetical protein
MSVQRARRAALPYALKQWLVTASIFAVLSIVMIGCSPNAAQVPGSITTVVDTALPSATIAPSATLEPTATASPSPQPSATLTLVSTETATLTATVTPVPPLALVEAGFSVWCSPLSYTGAFQPGIEVPQPAWVMKAVSGQLEVQIPAEFCTLVYTFNQAAPDGMQVLMFDGNQKPFLKANLDRAEGHPEMLFAAVKQPYVVNPPFWLVDYRIDIQDANGQVLHSDSVRFAKPLPEPCPYGGLPDPVTLYCAATDPWEMEPHPGIKYPYPTFTPGSPD